MERVCFPARIRPERLDEYRERNKQVWPALRAAGWGDYSLFLGGDGLLVGYLETDDYRAAIDGMAALDRNDTAPRRAKPGRRGVPGGRPPGLTQHLDEE